MVLHQKMEERNEANYTYKKKLTLAKILNKPSEPLRCAAWSQRAQAYVPEVNRGGH